MRRWKSLVAAGIIICVATAGGIIGLTVHQNRVAALQLEYYELMKMPDGTDKVGRIQAFIDGHPKDDEARLAEMWLGAYYQEKGDLAEALSTYQKVLKKAGRSPLYDLAVEAIVPIYIESGKGDEGARLCLDAAMGMKDDGADLFRLKAASVYEVVGKGAEAQEIYRSLIAGEKTSPEIKMKAEEQLLWIAASHE